MKKKKTATSRKKVLLIKHDNYNYNKEQYPENGITTRRHGIAQFSKTNRPEILYLRLRSALLLHGLLKGLLFLTHGGQNVPLVSPQLRHLSLALQQLH